MSNFDNIFPILSITLPNNASIHNVNLLNIHKNLFNIKRLQNSNTDNYITVNNFTHLQSIQLLIIMYLIMVITLNMIINCLKS